MSDSKKDLILAIKNMNDVLTDAQHQAVMDYLTAYAIHLTDSDMEYVAKIIGMTRDYAYQARDLYKKHMGK
jgi:NADH:ubiquinone oxidoreductase subunit E